MKVIAFTIPVRQDQTVIVKREQRAQFYPHLHRHEEIQLSWIQKGAGTLVVGEELYPFRAGDIFLFGANLAHLFKSDKLVDLSTNEDCISLSLFFKKDNPLWQLPELKREGLFLSQLQGAFKVRMPFEQEVQGALKKIAERPGSLRLPLFIELMQRLILLSGLEMITKSVHPPVSEREGLRMNTILQFAIKNYRRTINLEEASRQVHMVPGSFCRFFKQHTGKTFIRFLNELRIQEACRQLAQNPQGAIADTAFSCGFKNVSSFNRVFRQIKRQSPSAYLRSLRKVVG